MSEEYRVIARDGREYGPADLATLIQWVQEGRVLPRTLVRRGADPPREAQTFPELADAFAARGVAVGRPSEAPPEAAASGAPPAEFRVWGFLGQAWDLVRPHWLVLGGMFFINTAIGWVPYIGILVQFIVGGAIMVGIWRAILGLIDGRAPDVGMMFEGFDRWLDAFLACLVRAILTFLGLLCLIVPGIILAIMWMFTYPVLAESRADFWQAMKTSAALTEGYRWRLFLLCLASIPVLLLGLLALCVGVFVALAVVFTAFGLAYRFLQERRRLAGGTI